MKAIRVTLFCMFVVASILMNACAGATQPAEVQPAETEKPAEPAATKAPTEVDVVGQAEEVMREYMAPDTSWDAPKEGPDIVPGPDRCAKSADDEA